MSDFFWEQAARQQARALAAEARVKELEADNAKLRADQRRRDAEVLRWAADMKQQLGKSDLETYGEWLSRLADEIERGKDGEK